MPTIKYTGQSHFRELSAADFKRVGIEDQLGIKLARSDIFPEQNTKKHPLETEVSQAAADWLLTYEAGEWEVVQEDDVLAPAGGDAPDASAGGSPSASSRAGKKPSS